MNARLTCTGMLLSGSLFLLSCSKNPGTMHSYTISNALRKSCSYLSSFQHSSGCIIPKAHTTALWINNDGNSLSAGNRLSSTAVLIDSYTYYTKYHAAKTARTFPLDLHP